MFIHITACEILVLLFRYKDDVILDFSSGRYLIETTGGIHSLEIMRYSEQHGIYIILPNGEIIIQPIISTQNVCNSTGQDRYI